MREWRADKFSCLAVLAGMPNAQDINLGLLDFVTYLVTTDQNSAHLTGRKLFEPLTNAGLFQQQLWCSR